LAAARLLLHFAKVRHTSITAEAKATVALQILAKLSTTAQVTPIQLRDPAQEVMLLADHLDNHLTQKGNDGMHGSRLDIMQLQAMSDVPPLRMVPATWHITWVLCVHALAEQAYMNSMSHCVRRSIILMPVS
jgi:hypothetical protein